MRWLVVVALLGGTGCDTVFQLEEPAEVGPGVPGFAFRKPITLRAPTSADLVDYPAAIIIPSDPDLAAHVEVERFLFTADDGITVLPFEIERFDPATGALHAWVKIPRLTGGGMTDIHLHYGPHEGEDPPANNPAAVWISGYAAVWHLDGDVDVLFDSTSDGNDLHQLSPARQPKPTTGLVGEARGFDGSAVPAESDALAAADQFGLDAGLESFTYSVWVKVGTPAGEFDMPLFKGGAAETVAGYDFELGNSDWVAQVSDGTGTAVNAVVLPAAQALALRNQWVHLVAVVDRENVQLLLYVNGSRVDATALTEGSLSNDRDVTLSYAEGDQSWFAGEIDEVRLFHGAIGPNWIRTEYENIAKPGAFLEIGSEEALR